MNIIIIILYHRREYTKRQRIVHTYGDNEEEAGEEERVEMVRSSLAEASAAATTVQGKSKNVFVVAPTI